MNFERVFILVCIILTLHVGDNRAVAQRVKFTRIEVKKNERIGSDVMLQMQFDAVISGAKGHRCRAYLFVYRGKNEPHYYSNGKKMISKADALDCLQEKTVFKNSYVRILNRYLNPMTGPHIYYARIRILDETTKKWISESKLVPFKMTGRGQVQAQQPQPTQPSSPVTPSAQPVQPVVTNPPVSQPTPPRTRRVRVVTGRCTNCNGTGLVLWSGYSRTYEHHCSEYGHYHISHDFFHNCSNPSCKMDCGEPVCNSCGKSHCTYYNRHDQCKSPGCERGDIVEYREEPY